MKRREFLTVPAAAIGGTLLYTLAGEPFRLQAQNGTVKVPLRFFTADEARVVTAACERIFPSDASGPGATEAGVVIFIDRQLAGPYGRDKYRYTKGPWVESVPEHGYQGRENPQEIYRKGIKDLGNFASLPAEEIYHAAQERGFTWGAVRPPEALLDDQHLHDRGFWKEVAHPELGRSFVYPGEAAIYNGSPWRISRRAPLLGEHNAKIFCDELGLSRTELSVLAESRVV